MMNLRTGLLNAISWLSSEILIQWVWGGAQESVFWTCIQMVLIRQLWEIVPLTLCCWKCGLQTCAISISRGLVRNAESQALPRPAVRICILTASPGDSPAPLSLRDTAVKYLLIGSVCRKSSHVCHLFPLVCIKKKQKDWNNRKLILHTRGRNLPARTRRSDVLYKINCST